MSTDLFSCGDDGTVDGDPFVSVEAKAVALDARLKYAAQNHGHGLGKCGDDDTHHFRNEVHVTIGLFTIIRIFRIVQLLVESKGFCTPEECEDLKPHNPCELFENLDFPMDVFAPPQKPEFQAGITSNIPRKKEEEKKICSCGAVIVKNTPCGCGGHGVEAAGGVLH
jgi:hypothetical protein